MNEPTRHLACAVCGDPIGVGERFLHFRWAGPGGQIEVLFHPGCHADLEPGEFESVVGETVDELLTLEPEVYESQVDLYDSADVKRVMSDE